MSLGQGVLAQCPNTNIFYSDMTPAAVGQTVTDNCYFPGDYATVTVCNGGQYTFQTCGSSIDTEITLLDDTSPFSVLAYNNDACGAQSSVTWTATFSGVVRVLVNEFPCSQGSGCLTLEVTWDSGCSSPVGPGDDCTSPIAVACGSTLTGQTTLNNSDTESEWSCTTLFTPGGDRYYSVNVTDSLATVVRVTMTNVSDDDTYVNVVQASLPCSGSNCNNLVQFDVGLGTFSGTGLNSFDFPVTGAGNWTFIVDSQGDGVSDYDITFECLSSGIEMDTSGCAGPPADSNADGYEVRWNGLLAGSLENGDVGTICYDLFITNPNATAGWEWLKTVEFTLGSCWTNVQNITPSGLSSGNGFFNSPGTWTGSYSPVTNVVSYNFVNATNSIWGDGNASGMSCAQYSFCFQAEVDTTRCSGATNNGLDIIIFAEDDGVGRIGSTQASSALTLSPEFFLSASLPVEMAGFDAWLAAGDVNLAWSTSLEVNNDHFRVERSSNKGHFQDMAILQARGNSRELTRYTYVDKYPEEGENHYRLYQVDRDGREKVVGQKVLYYTAKNEVELVAMGPNPTQGRLTLQLTSSSTNKLVLEVSDQVGRLVMRKDEVLLTGENLVELDMTGWAAGSYLLQLHSTELDKTVKIMKRQ